MDNFHHQKIEQILTELQTSVYGLNSEEASQRQKKHGFNKLPESKPIKKTAIFLNQFKNPLIFILLFACLISLILKQLTDTWVIGAAIFINTIVGFLQENKTNNSLNKLRQMVSHKAYVLRDGNELEVDSTELVAGDAILIKSGNRIPADARLIEIETDDLIINESALTGESIPSEKDTEIQKKGAALADRKNMVYAGTIAVKGLGKAIVTAIAENTEIGKIADLVHETEEGKTPLQIKLSKFSNLLGIVVGIIASLIIIVGVFQERPLFDMFIMGVALAVSAIPEGLIVAVTVVLVLGMQRILKKQALVRKLVAAETLGSTTVICTDKTGTLTEGKMQVSHIIIGEKEYELNTLGSRQDNIEAKVVSLALQTAMMCNDAFIENPDDELESWRFVGAPTEVALMAAAIQSGLNKEKLLKIEPKVKEFPFDSENKYMISLHKKSAAGFIIYEKGAPEIILKKSKSFYHEGKIRVITAEDKRKLDNIYKKLTSRGLRVIAACVKNLPNSLSSRLETNFNWQEIDNDLVFIGFIGIKDPLRPEAKETIKICRQAGVRPVIVTGDHQLTAIAIANEVGFNVSEKNVINGEMLDKLSDEELKNKIKKTDIYARISPHHKLRIVKALQEKNEVVAMTGDGVNDSPALKAADIGISLGTGTDIAKESSDIILLDNNLKTIISAIKEGRVIFSNIRKIITYLISDSFGEVILIMGCILLGLPLALFPVQILWINIIGDGFPNFSLAFEKGDNNMSKKPIAKKEPIMTTEMKTIIFGAGLVRSFFIFLFFLYLLYINVEINYIRTLIFSIIAVTSLASIFSIRQFHRPIWQVNPFSNLYLIGAAAVSFLLLIFAIYWAPLQGILSTVPLSANIWPLIIIFGIINILMIEIVKIYFIIKKEY